MRLFTPRCLLAVAVVLSAGCGKSRDEPFAPPMDPSVPTFVAADVGFMQEMLIHHRQALTLSGMAPSHGSDRAVAAISKEILATRGTAVTLEQWLAGHKQSIPDTNATVPGGLMAEQFGELEQMHGAAWDRAFLNYMIRNHQLSLQTIETLASVRRTGRAAETFTLAASIDSTRRDMLGRMQIALQALPRP